jgi:hypothetical protein
MTNGKSAYFMFMVKSEDLKPKPVTSLAALRPAPEGMKVNMEVGKNDILRHNY